MATQVKTSTVKNLIKALGGSESSANNAVSKVTGSGGSSASSKPGAGVPANIASDVQWLASQGFLKDNTQTGVNNAVAIANKAWNPTSQTYDASKLGDAKGVVVPTPPKSELTGNEVTTNNLALGLNADGTQKVDPTKLNMENNDVKTFVQAFKDTVGEKESATDVRQNANDTYEVDKNRLALNDATNRLNAVTNQQTADIMAIRNQSSAEGGTAGILSAREDAINRSAVIKALPIQMEVAIAQGNYQYAQDKANELYQTEMADINANYEYKTKLFDMAYQVASNAQKTAIEDKRQAESYLRDEQSTNAKYKNEILMQFAKDGNTAGIRAITNIDPKDTNFQTKFETALSTISGVNSNIPNGKYSGIINTILGSGKFTAAQVKLVTNAIANGEDPMTVIRNQAKNILGTEGKELTKYESARDSMIQLDSQLKEFYNAGGSSGIFSGNFEKVTNKLGSVSDPNLVDLAVQIAASLQKYRNAISGTAYSEQEGRDIASIFPGINKGELLNSTIVKARLKTLDSDIDSLYTNALGSGYTQLKSLQNESPPSNNVANIDDQYTQEYEALYGKKETPVVETKTETKPKTDFSNMIPKSNIDWGNMFNFGSFLKK